MGFFGWDFEQDEVDFHHSFRYCWTDFPFSQ